VETKSDGKSEALVSKRVQGDLEHLMKTRPYFPNAVRHLVADSLYSKKTVVNGVIELELQLVSKLRIDANLRYYYVGPQKPRGAHRKYYGKVDLNDLSRMEFIGEVDEDIFLYSQIVWHIFLKRKIRIVYLVNTTKMRPLVNGNSSRTWVKISQPDLSKAGVIYLVQISRSESCFLFMI
jgi:hypothetical protein